MGTLALTKRVCTVLALCGAAIAASPADQPSTGRSSPEPAAGLSSLPGAQGPLVGDPWLQQAWLTASDGAPADWFGTSVAVDGTTAVVGAPDHMVGSNQRQGAAYVFARNGDGTWSQRAELTASDGVALDHFGVSVAISGGTIMVGTPFHPVSNNPGPGAVYVFTQKGDGTWSQQAELGPSDDGGDFGSSLAISGSTAVVGAPVHSANQGAAYIFVANGTTWSQQAELLASNGASEDLFGASVAVSGSTAVVGATGKAVGSNGSQGAAYVFVQSGAVWSQQAELTASDGAADDFFGSSVAVDGSTVLVGADQHTVGSNVQQGAAYVFVQSGTTWSQEAELTNSNGQVYDYFGDSVALSGGTAVVGASNHASVTYVFMQSGTTWSQQAILTALDGVSFTYSFGTSVALSGTTVAVGAPASGTGAAYVFGSTTVSPSPTSLNFDSQVINTTSAVKTVMVKNTGVAMLDISNIVPSADFAISSTTCGGTLAVGKTCKVSVTFTPTEPSKVTSTLSINDNGPNSPQMVWLFGMGVEPASLNPPSATYGAHKVGTTGAARTFTLANNQVVALTGISISTTGDFAVSATTCGTSLNAKAKCTISVKFTATATGTQTGQLIINDSANNSPQTSNLSGEGK